MKRELIMENIEFEWTTDRNNIHETWSGCADIYDCGNYFTAEIKRVWSSYYEVPIEDLTYKQIEFINDLALDTFKDLILEADRKIELTNKGKHHVKIH